jgi:hypothetical protein
MIYLANMGRRAVWRRAAFALALTFAATPCLAAASLTVKVDQNGNQLASGLPVYTMHVNVPTTIELVVTGAKLIQPVPWPNVNGLTLNGSGYDPNQHAYTFFLSPSRPGDFVVPAFNVRADDGETLHVGPIKFHAVKQ